MERRHRGIVARSGLFAACLLGMGTLVLSSSGCGGSDGETIPAPISLTRRVEGASQAVSGATVKAWATLDANNTVQEVGVTLPMRVVMNPPTDGSGPSGAAAVVAFPAEVQSSTYFDHFEMHWNPQGHPPAQRYGVPHFDFHFYSVTPQAVAAITPPDPTPPTADRVPAGYAYSGANQTVPQMGVHAVAGSEFAPNAPPFSASMVLGYYGGQMHFVEPMVTQDLMIRKQNFALTVPVPTTLGRSTRYPTRFTGIYDAGTDSYNLVFSNFVTTTQ